MTVTNVDFKVKNGLEVAGNATFDSNVILGNTPISYDSVNNRLQIQINGTWIPVAYTSDIPDSSNDISFMDIGLSIDYNGQPTYIVQANGVTPSGTSKFLDGGDPSTTSAQYFFDSGVIV
jgi:hypothetical protein